ncbi:MAG: hypothetical protein J6K75_03295 [Erysipelotrichaceae bacterium]|nr:hypothetical protein [Erysipelotrichaceae bacterium]MBQ7890039.1 hypothetical protein [Erysipelotrichaceae bacterium]
MKNTKICPKCHSTNLIRIKGSHEKHGNNIPLGNPVFSYARVNRYICCSCGYTEEWIDQNDLEKINECKKVLEKNEKA